MNTEERENAEDKKQKEKTEIQITVNVAAEMRVAVLVAKVNDGFDHGRVSRKDLASYLLIKACDEFTHDDIAKVRSLVLTDVILLEHLLRAARETGSIPTELREMLWKNINLTPSAKKSKKAGQVRVNNVNSSESEAA